MFFSGNKSKLGIDIGTSSIKIVELKKEENRYELLTYGMVNVHSEGMARMEYDVIAETASILKKLLAEAEVTSKKAVASLPNNIVFVSVIEMPGVSEKEMKDAVQWEARRYIPMPLEEVTLSWSMIGPATNGEPHKVLLTAVPTSVIDNYIKMFKLAGIIPLALEIEALALIRCLVGVRKDSFFIIDIGARNTSLNLIEKGFLRLSRNLPIGGDSITNAIAQSLHVSFGRAEQFKKDLGLTGGLQQIPQTMKPAMDSIKNEMKQLLKIFESTGGSIQEVIFAGSGSKLPGLLGYFADLKIKTGLGDPLKYINYDPGLKQNLSERALDFSVALGLGMRE
ncbi:MAG: type IV pilus assembly protein PilM [bacterium]|nr:type IV pilus assembly protein PilM [bacterium]